MLVDLIRNPKDRFSCITTQRIVILAYIYSTFHISCADHTMLLMHTSRNLPTMTDRSFVTAVTYLVDLAAIATLRLVVLRDNHVGALGNQHHVVGVTHLTC